MFFIACQLNSIGFTLLVRGLFLVDGGSGRSQVGGIPALAGKLNGVVLLISRDSIIDYYL